jgi:endoglucanase
VRVNQVGYLPDGPKHATLVTEATTPLAWRLLDASGAEVLAGESEPRGLDPTAGLNVQVIDFSAATAAGEGFVLEADGDKSHPFAIDGGIYADLARDALSYFYPVRSGIAIDGAIAGEAYARPAGHVSAPKDGEANKGDREVPCQAPESSQKAYGEPWTCDYTLDVTGGWYDAGDHGKYVVNGGISVWTLLNLHERQIHLDRPALFADGRATIPESGNGVDDLLDEVRWELEFLLAMQVPDGTRTRVAVGVRRGGPGLRLTEIDASGMAHHKMGDRRWTQLPMPPHRDPEPRLLYPPSTGATLNLAANAAQCARIWRTIDPAFSARCLTAAERAWRAALRNPEVHAVGNFTGSGGYGDADFADEFFWAAAELFATTAGETYRAALRRSSYFSAPVAEPGWGSTATLGTITLAVVPNRLAAGDVAAIRARLVAAADRFLASRDQVGYRIPYPPPYPWGSNSNLLNRAIILALAHDFTGDVQYRDGVIDGLDYLLGRNPLDRSFISGYGARPMRNPHHRFWAQSLDPALPPPPPGALSGGPNNTNMSDEVARPMRGRCAPQMCWADDIRAFSLNEVAVNWNAPLVWVAAWIAEPR